MFAILLERKIKHLYVGNKSPHQRNRLISIVNIKKVKKVNKIDKFGESI